LGLEKRGDLFLIIKILKWGLENPKKKHVEILWSGNLGFNLEKTRDFVLIKKKRVGNQKKDMVERREIVFNFCVPSLFTMMFLRFSMGSP